MEQVPGLKKPIPAAEHARRYGFTEQGVIYKIRQGILEGVEYEGTWYVEGPPLSPKKETADENRPVPKRHWLRTHAERSFIDLRPPTPTYIRIASAIVFVLIGVLFLTVQMSLLGHINSEEEFFEVALVSFLIICVGITAILAFRAFSRDNNHG